MFHQPSSASNLAPTQKVVSIQYLRAIAALMVVAYHAFSRVSDGLPDYVASYAQLGHGGVDLFFVISGFVIWTVGGHTRSTPAQFISKRAIRVVPMYWVATGLTIVAALLLGQHWIKLPPAHILQSLLFLPHWSPSFSGTFWPVLVPGWTLIFELFFYATFAITLCLNPRFRLLALTAALIGLVSVGLLFSFESAPFHAYTSPLLLEFLAGCWIAQIYKNGTVFPALGAIAICVSLLILIFLAPYGVTNQTSWLRPATYGLFGACLVFGAVQLEQRMPRLPFLERLGDASYSMYLFHILLVQFLTTLLRQVTQNDSALISIAFVTVSLSCSCWLGLLLYAKFERPITGKLNKIYSSN